MNYVVVSYKQLNNNMLGNMRPDRTGKRGECGSCTSGEVVQLEATTCVRTVLCGQPLSSFAVMKLQPLRKLALALL